MSGVSLFSGETCSSRVREREVAGVELILGLLCCSLVGHVQEAINHGMQPKLNSKGSSGSYFAKDIHGNTLGIFKPKDEEVSCLLPLH